MTWNFVSTGSAFEKKGGFSRAMYDDEWVFVSGTTGFDYATMTISDDFAEQTRQTWRNISAALEQAGSHLGEIVTFLLVLGDRSDFPTLLELGNFMPHQPAGTALCAQFVDPRIKIEIQVTAKRASTTKPAETLGNAQIGE